MSAPNPLAEVRLRIAALSDQIRAFADHCQPPLVVEHVANLRSRRSEWIRIEAAIRAGGCSLLTVWWRENGANTPPPDALVDHAHKRIAELDSGIAVWEAQTFVAMCERPSIGIDLYRRRKDWVRALNELVIVRYTCWACDRELGLDEVCTRCCGGEAIPGRCALSPKEPADA